MAQVVLRQLAKHYGEIAAVDHIDLTIRDRELLVLVGPSGCGKTTTLRMVAGLEDISAGEIQIGDRVVNRVAPKDRDIAMVFQNYALYPHMNVFQNMAFGLRMRRAPRAEVELRVSEAARVLGIGDLMKRKPAQLSGGQRQRVAVGRAIVRSPAVFLFDEPLSNLDAKLRVSMRTELVKLQKRLTTTMIYVTHDQVEAMMMGDRIVVMNQGRIQQVGEPMEVYESPANRFVAEFIGSPPMNFFHAALAGEATDAVLQIGAHRLPIPPGRLDAAAHALNRPVVVGLRPEHIGLYVPADAQADGEQSAQLVSARFYQLSAEVIVSQPLGAETIVDIQSELGELVSRVDASVRVHRGDQIKALLDLDQMHLFDADSGQSLR